VCWAWTGLVFWFVAKDGLVESTLALAVRRRWSRHLLAWCIGAIDAAAWLNVL
jgi:hypothetical protein